MKRIAKRILASMIAIALPLCIVGCSGSPRGAQDSGEAQKTTDAASFASSITKEVSFNGLTFHVDPKWKNSPTDDDSLRYDPSSSSVVAARTFADGETADIAAYESKVGGIAGKARDYDIVKEWQDGTVSYTAYNYDDSRGDSNTYLLGYEDGGKGFCLYFNRGAGSVDGVLSDEVLEKIYSTIKFSPDAVKTNLDEDEANQAEKEKSVEKTPEPSTPSATASQQNALRMAKSYIGTMPFSYTGLIGQLEYEQFSTEDATYGADNCGADWNEQAVKMAKNYLDTMPFSYSGLIEQLEYEGFTPEQATYGADSTGL